MTGRKKTAGTPKPFLKWAGGKGQLVEKLARFLPREFTNYYEPFFGGGAFFFHLQPQRAFLNDINPVLMATYKVVKNNPRKLIQDLRALEKEYLALKPSARRSFYNHIRDRYNDLRAASTEKSACLIFLNRTCFNGLYRENSSGKFNVPFGDNKNPKVCDEETLVADAKVLKGANLTSFSFERAVATAKKGDFIYFDPPYYPVKTSSFTSYDGSGFTGHDHVRLRDVFVALDKRGCKVMLSNSATKFVKELYADYRIEVVDASRSINSKGSGRGKVKEIVIMNY